MNKISFFGKRKLLKLYGASSIKALMVRCASDHEKTIEHINCVVINDEELLEVNKKYLNHDYYTDIITFDLSHTKNTLRGDIFISQDRVIENQSALKTEHEFLRVCIHGVLHLIGYADKTKSEKIKMRAMENHYLNLYPIYSGETKSFT